MAGGASAHSPLTPEWGKESDSRHKQPPFPAAGEHPLPAPAVQHTAALHSIRICSSSVTSAMDSFRSSTNFCISSEPRAQKCSTCFFSEPESGVTRVMP